VILLVGIGYYMGNKHSLSLIETNEQLVQSLNTSQETNETLKQQLVMQEQMNRVEQAANAEAGQSLESKYREIRELERELRFYRNILAPEESVKGLQISQFQWQAIDNRRIGWQVSLLQAGSQGRMMSGLATIDLIVMQGGQENRIPVTNASGNREFGFKFRYFQHLTGDIELSQDVVPVAIEVTARQYGTNSTPIVKRFDWEQSPQEAIAYVE
jgi:hypothetical protein